MKKILLLFSLIVLIPASAQQVIISGYVTDKNSGEAIIGANILNTENGKGASSNKFGYFSLQIKKDEPCMMQVSYIGYRTEMISLRLSSDSLVTVRMNPTTEYLDEIQVIAQKRLEERVETGRMNIPISTVKTIPSITGEPDVLKVFQLMPGVQMGAENTNGLFVRGGSSDQNLFLLDDVPLYNVNHLGGFFSVFDPSMLKSVDLYKGGFPARYGGRVSSVMDVRNKDGNMNERGGEVALGLISAKVFLEGPLKKGKSSYALSYRYCNFGIYSLLMNSMQGENYTQGYHFYDINLKTNFILSPTDRLFLSFYSGDDNVYYNEKNAQIERTNYIYSGKSNIKWGNTAGSLRWLHVFDSGIFNNTTLYFTRYNYRNSAETETYDKVNKIKLTDIYQAQSGVNDFSIKNDAEVPLNNKTLRFGMAATGHVFIPGSISYSNSSPDTENVSSSIRINAFSLNGYAELEFPLLKDLSVNTGFRTGLYVVNNTTYPTIEPRIIINQFISPAYALKASYNRMSQHTHLLSNSNGGLPTDIWIPSTDKIKPLTADQFSIGLAHTTSNDYEISLDLYTKKISNLIDYQEGMLAYKSIQNLDKSVETGGVGNIQGIEFLLQKKTGSLNGWISYALSSNKRRFENINNGKAYPYVYDQPHNFTITGNYKISNNITLSAVWVYHTGNCITLPSARYKIIDYSGNRRVYYSEVEIYTEKNGYRLPDYHRLDLSANFSRKMRKGERNWSLNVYNAYNRQNAYYLFYKKAEDGSMKLYQRSFFPILFNASYGFKW